MSAASFRLIALALLVAVASATTCFDVKDRATCKVSSQDGQPCVWCNCHAVPSSCVTIDQAKKLPPSVFTCEFPSQLSADVLSCLTIKDKATCESSEESPQLPCSWCESKAVPSSCVNAQQATRLPPGVFNCSSTTRPRGPKRAYRPRAVIAGTPLVGRTPAEQVFIGIAEGLAEAALPDLTNCIQDAVDVYDDLRSFADHLHLSVSDVEVALQSLANGLKSFEAVMSDCHIAQIGEKVAEFVAKVDSIIGDIEIATEIVINGINVYEDLNDAVSAWDDGSYLQCGYKIADAIAIIL